MTQDQNKKTLRHFQCRDYLWDIFEQMSAELECSTDYLINEAMRQYARSRNYGTREAASEASRSGPPAPSAASRPSIPSLRPGPTSRPISGSMPPPPPGSAARSSNAGPTPQAPPPAPSQPQMRASVPPPLPRSQRPQPAPPTGPHGTAAPQQLYIIFNGQKIPVNKPEFVIGRGAKSADLPIKDGNISRRHAAVVYQNGQYFMKDLGSTNGVEFSGQRIDAKQIQEGDIFRMCDYELQFTYQ